MLIVLAESYSAYLATLLIMFGTIVKLFPFFGVTLLLKEPKKKFLLLFAACFLVLVTYMAAAINSIKASRNLTMRGDGASYGTDVFVTRYGPAVSRALSHWLSPSQLGVLLKYGSLSVGSLLILVILIRALTGPEGPETLSQRNFAAFRMGASIYIGTFLLGNNWDYRLAFLVLVVPQLVEWMRSPIRMTRTFAWLSMSLVLLSCWHFWISAIPLESVFNSVEDSMKFWFILDETFNWLLFASLAFLLFASTPGRLKELPLSLISRTRSRLRHEHGSPPIS